MTQPAERTRIVVIVVRSGGVAGLRREWRAEPPDADADRWIGLVDGCPWDALEPLTGGADRYVWSIHVRLDDTPAHEAELGDTQLEGPWRALVDEVRQAAPSRVGQRRR